MNIKKIEQYSAIKNEIKMLEKRIEELRLKPDVVVCDTVSGSSLSMPYAMHTIVIEGVDNTKGVKISKLSERLRVRESKLLEMMGEIEDFIDTIDDSEIRQIIQLRYLDGRSWRNTANKIYGYPCEDRARKRITRFFAEI